jgi:two-component system OmpR family sensor kinase
MRMWRSTRRTTRFPLRVHLVVLVCSLIVAVVGVIGVVSVTILHQNLVTQAENGVYLASDNAIGRVAAEVDSPADLESLNGPFGLFASPDGYYVIADGDDVLFSVYVAPDYSARDLTAAESAAILRPIPEDETTSVTVPGLGEFLSLRTTLTLADGPAGGLTFVTGGGLDDANATLRAFVLAELVIGLARPPPRSPPSSVTGWSVGNSHRWSGSSTSPTGSPRRRCPPERSATANGCRSAMRIATPRPDVSRAR